MRVSKFPSKSMDITYDKGWNVLGARARMRLLKNTKESTLVSPSKASSSICSMLLEARLKYPSCVWLLTDPLSMRDMLFPLMAIQSSCMLGGMLMDIKLHRNISNLTMLKNVVKICWMMKGVLESLIRTNVTFSLVLPVKWFPTKTTFWDGSKTSMWFRSHS